MVDKVRGHSADNNMGQRGRSAEARDPNRAVDPNTGEKVPLPERYPETTGDVSNTPSTTDSGVEQPMPSDTLPQA